MLPSGAKGSNRPGVDRTWPFRHGFGHLRLISRNRSSLPFRGKLRSGAQTPAAGAFTAVGVALATLFLTPLIFFLPKATLAAIIIVAVISLVDVAALKHTYSYSKADFAAMAATILVTCVKGVEIGLIVGVGLSIFLHLYATSKPHVAVVGQIPGP